ncbi:protein NAP1 [Nymphaea colorata]|nr:protein NAP1 [Nymphaea colorata]
MARMNQQQYGYNLETSPTHVHRSRDLDSMSRWTEYLSSEAASPPSVTSSSKHVVFSMMPPSVGSFHKGRSMECVFQLTQVAEGLLAKMHKFVQILDHPDPTQFVFSDSFWKAGVLPDFPKFCVHLAKKFPEHPSSLQLEKVDKVALETLQETSGSYLQNLEPWIELLVDLMAFREQALRIILDLSSTVITLLPHQNSLILHAFMDLFCAFVRANLSSSKIPWKMILQVYNLLHLLTKGGRDCEFYHRLVQFVDSYDPPLKGLQEDLNFVSPRVGEVLEAVGPIIFLSTDTKKLRNEGFLSPFHPRYPDILTNSAHPMRAQDLANVMAYQEWVLLGYLVCPSELLRVTGIDISMVALKENFILPLFRDEYILLHEEYQLYVLPRVSESKRMAKSGRTKQKEADLEYTVAKQVEKMICDVHEQALMTCDAIHHERRVMLKQEIGRMVLFFTDQPSLLAPNIQMVFSALALSRYEILWYFQHIGVSSLKSKGTRITPIEIDATDSTIGFLLDGMDRLCCLVRKYATAIRAYALSYLSSSAERIRFLLGTPGMVALDLDATLRGLFQQVIQSLESLPKTPGDNAQSVSSSLSELRKSWLSVLMIITSSRSSINIRHLEKATMSTGKEGLVSEGNAAYMWSRCIDELESQLSEHGSLHKLYFYHHHLTTVFRNTMFGPEGRPHHCCAWLGVASSFPECASLTLSDEITRIGRDAVLYVESLIESIMGGLEGLINILDSDGGFGSLEHQLFPEQAAIRMNYASKLSNYAAKSPKGITILPLPGRESFPENNNSVKMLEAATQRLTNLCSVLNEMEPICVLNHVFVLREYMRDTILSNFRRRMLAILKTDNDLQRPSVLETLIHRHLRIINLVEQHVSMDLTQGIREIFLSEAFCGPLHYLKPSVKLAEYATGSAVQIVCDWYIDNIIKDVNNVGILFTPSHKCFKSARPVGGYFADSIADLAELKAFVRLFGGYGVDKLDRLMREHTAALLNCIDIALQSNREALEAISASFHSCDPVEKECSVKQIVDMETVIGFCIQAGQALAFSSLLAEAAGEVLDENVPLLFSLMSGLTRHLPVEIPEKAEIGRLRAAASSINVSFDHDTDWVRSILVASGCANVGALSLLPYLFASFMTSSIWSITNFSIDTGGFSNNIHCLARCINAVIAASEFVRLERKELQKQSLSNGHASETSDPEIQNLLSVEASIKSVMQLYVKCASSMIMDSWNETSRSHLVPKLIFLDQLCKISPYLPRSTIEVHIPYTILRSIYRQYYGNSQVSQLALLSPSPRQSPAVLLSHASSPAAKLNNVDANPEAFLGISPALRTSGPIHQQLIEPENMDTRQNDNKQRNMRRSGPLEYSSSRKGKHPGGPASGSRGVSPLPRMVSRSGPLSYK